VNRTVQWRVLKRMQCLLAEESQGATHDGIDACKEQTIDTSHLDLVYPIVPAKVDCSVQSGGPRPCGSDWLELYGQLPTNAPAGPCTQCPVDPWAQNQGQNDPQPQNEAPPDSCPLRCDWKTFENKVTVGGYADGDEVKFPNEGFAKLACLAKPDCKAVTLFHGGSGEIEYSLRASSSLEDSPNQPAPHDPSPYAMNIITDSDTTFITDCGVKFVCDETDNAYIHSPGNFNDGLKEAQMQYLEDRNGVVGMHLDKGEWQSWTMTRDGVLPDNVFFIKSHRGELLEDKGTAKGLGGTGTGYKGLGLLRQELVGERKASAEWTISPIDCEGGNGKAVFIRNAHTGNRLNFDAFGEDPRDGLFVQPMDAYFFSAQFQLTSGDGGEALCRWVK